MQNLLYMEVLKTINDAEELKKKYKELLLQYHPDNGGSDEQLLQLNDLYESLKNKKNKVTNPLTSLKISQEKEAPKQYINIVIDDIFKKTYNYTVSLYCEFCEGYNIRDNREKYACIKCFGTGKIDVKKYFNHIPYNKTITCDSCNGDMYTNIKEEDRCDMCNGGTIDKTLSLEITPDMINNVIFLKNKGDQPNINSCRKTLVITCTLNNDNFIITKDKIYYLEEYTEELTIFGRKYNTLEAKLGIPFMLEETTFVIFH